MAVFTSAVYATLLMALVYHLSSFSFEFGMVTSCPNCTRYFYNDSAANVNAEERDALAKAVAELNRNVFLNGKKVVDI